MDTNTPTQGMMWEKINTVAKKNIFFLPQKISVLLAIYVGRKGLLHFVYIYVSSSIRLFLRYKCDVRDR